MKRVTLRVFNYKTAKYNYDYMKAISEPSYWHFAIFNGALTYHSQYKYKTKAAAISAAKACRKHLKALRMI